MPSPRFLYHCNLQRDHCAADDIGADYYFFCFSRKLIQRMMSAGSSRESGPSL